jgi:hypothetical protein
MTCGASPLENQPCSDHSPSPRSIAATPALATEYTISGTGSGSLDGVAWSGDFTITADGGPPKPFDFGLIIDPLDESTVTIGGETVTITALTQLGNNTIADPPPADDIFFYVPSLLRTERFFRDQLHATGRWLQFFKGLRAGDERGWC